MHCVKTVKVCVVVGDINPKYPLITQPDYVLFAFLNITHVFGGMLHSYFIPEWLCCHLYSSYFLLENLSDNINTLHCKDVIVELCL